MGQFQDLMDRELRIRGYAGGTRECYLRGMRALVAHFMLPPDRLTPEHVKRFQLHLAQERQLAWSTFNTHVCAIRFFYRHVVSVPWEVEVVPFQRRPRRLPVVLSRPEVVALLDAIPNAKHLAITQTLYAAGLRVGEALRLQVADIDSDRMTIRVEQGKGRKDRYVMLSERLLETLRRYWYQGRPETWLFPGRDPARPLGKHSVGSMLRRAVERAGINKRVSAHTLRHSFATHLLEAGVSIRVIQRLLGHRSVRSTEIYTHVATTYVRDTTSPLDDLLPDLAGDTEPPAV